MCLTNNKFNFALLVEQIVKVAVIPPSIIILVGGATEEDVKLNQELLRGYFAQSLGRLAATGECHVALRRTLFYDSWDIVAQPERAGMRLSRVEKFEGD